MYAIMNWRINAFLHEFINIYFFNDFKVPTYQLDKTCYSNIGTFITIRSSNVVEFYWRHVLTRDCLLQHIYFV